MALECPSHSKCLQVSAASNCRFLFYSNSDDGATDHFALEGVTGGHGFRDQSIGFRLAISLDQLMALPVKRFRGGRHKGGNTHAPGGFAASVLKMANLLHESLLA